MSAAPRPLSRHMAHPVGILNKIIGGDVETMSFRDYHNIRVTSSHSTVSNVWETMNNEIDSWLLIRIRSLMSLYCVLTIQTWTFALYLRFTEEDLLKEFKSKPPVRVSVDFISNSRVCIIGCGIHEH